MGDSCSMDQQHSFGHGQECYWCGFDPVVDAERACDERLRKRPTDAQMAHYKCVSAIEDAQRELREALRVCENFGYLDAGIELRVEQSRLSEVIERLNRLRPPRA